MHDPDLSDLESGEPYVAKLILEPDVGTQDQQLALALDELRRAGDWLLCIRHELPDGRLIPKLLVSCSPQFMAETMLTIRAGLVQIALATADADEGEEAAA